MSTSSQFSQLNEQLGLRKRDSLTPCFTYSSADISSSKTHILQSSSDMGVARNGGRRGSKFAPQAILAPLSKMASHQLQQDKIFITEISNENLEKKNFVEAQEAEARSIADHFQKFNGKNFIHLGGGHDHVFPLLAGLYHPGRKIKVLNIDAHMDTRVDPLPHSGTPFRQFEKLAGKDFELIQLGLHSFANTPSTQMDFENGKMHCIDFAQLQKETANFTQPIYSLLEYHFNPQDLKNSDELWILSLDCDALEASIMEGVSAVNHQGIPLHSIEEMFHYFKLHAPKFIAGLYEYNPIFDNLSQKGSRALAKLIYGIL